MSALLTCLYTEPLTLVVASSEAPFGHVYMPLLCNGHPIAMDHVKSYGGTSEGGG
jgi:hypothetical protein